jgi:hypothetical protein
MEFLDEFSCRGWDTWGPMKLIRGMEDLTRKILQEQGHLLRD